jgi:hypothetical protein
MDPLNDTDRDRELTREDFGAPAGAQPRRWPSVLAGVLAVAGGAAIDLGLYRPLLAGSDTKFRDLVVWPDWRVRLGLSVAVGLFGLVAALLAGGVAGRTALGGMVVPALLLATINGTISTPVLDAAFKTGSFDQLALGGWLTLGGTAAVLIGALVALSQLGTRVSVPGAGVLAVLGTGGLLHGWIVGSFGHRGQTGVTAYSYFSVLAGGDRNGWITAVMIAGLTLALGAILLAAGRSGAVAAGIAAGAAVAIAIDDAIRFLMSDQLRGRDILLGTGGLDRNNAPMIAYAAAALLLVLLAIMLRGRPDSDVDPAGFEPVGEPTELYDPGTFGGTGSFTAPQSTSNFAPNNPTYDPTDRPFDQYTSGYGSRDPFQYLPEREQGNTGRYPLVEDDPPRGGALRPPRD